MHQALTVSASSTMATLHFQSALAGKSATAIETSRPVIRATLATVSGSPTSLSSSSNCRTVSRYAASDSIIAASGEMMMNWVRPVGLTAQLDSRTHTTKMAHCLVRMIILSWPIRQLLLISLS
ncbi:MAG: Uncharacterised protein [Halieaceae bacterium]|nr:MAG: Uncharacterised protein [Halieaceae bacterium]